MNIMKHPNRKVISTTAGRTDIKSEDNKCISLLGRDYKYIPKQIINYSFLLGKYSLNLLGKNVVFLYYN